MPERCCRACGAPVELPLANFCAPCRSLRRRKTRKWVPTDEIDAIIRDAWEGQHYHRKSVVVACKRTGWPRHAVVERARQIGAAKPRRKEPDWNPEEIQVLETFAWMHPASIQKKLLYACGTKRTETAIILKRKRLRLLSSLDGYSATQLAGLFGIDCKTVLRWIKWGWLHAERRGSGPLESCNRDTYWITHKAVRECVLSHPEAVNLGKADKLWIMDLLSDGKIGIRDHLRGAA